MWKKIGPVLFIIFIIYVAVPDGLWAKYVFHPLGISTPKERLWHKLTNDVGKIYQFGETVKFDDGLEIYAGKPQVFTPSEQAQISAVNWTAVKVDIVITNNGQKAINAFFLKSPSMRSDNKAASYIQDPLNLNETNLAGNELQPGQTIEITLGYSVKNPRDLELTFNDMNSKDEDSGSGEQHHGAVFVNY